MCGCMQVMFVVVGFVVVLLLFWLSVVVGSLVLLWCGFGDVFGVLVWVVLLVMFWWYLGDLSIFLVLFGILMLVQILCVSMFWSYVLLGSVVVGVVFVLVLGYIFSELIGVLVMEVIKVLIQFCGEFQLLGEELDKLQVVLVLILIGVMVFLLQVICLFCLMFVWYWQVLLYNLGGFGCEFWSLWLVLVVVVILLLGVVVVLVLEVQVVVFGLLCSVLLIIVGVVFGYGLIVLKCFVGGWLVGLYLVVLLLGNLICFLVVVDSLFDFCGCLVWCQGFMNGEG